MAYVRGWDTLRMRLCGSGPVNHCRSLSFHGLTRQSSDSYSCRRFGAEVANRGVARSISITTFVAAGFEHSIANLYFVPMGLLLRGDAEILAAAQRTPADLANLTWGNFLWANLLPVTLGNIAGGAGMVGLVYWFVYLRKEKI